MSDEHRTVEWSLSVLIVCAFLLLVLCLGEPDLLDAIIERVRR